MYSTFAEHQRVTLAHPPLVLPSSICTVQSVFSITLSTLATQAPLPHLLYNHVPLPLPSLSPCSGNRVNPLGSTKCVWVRGEPTLKKEIPLYPPFPLPHHQHSAPSPPPFVVLSCFPNLPSFSPPSPQVQGYHNRMRCTERPNLFFRTRIPPLV